MNTIDLPVGVVGTDDFEDFNFEIIEEGEWTTDLKYEHKETILKHLDTGKYYSWVQMRSGSYHTDYYYDDDEYLVEVEPKSVTVTHYVVVK